MDRAVTAGLGDGTSCLSKELRDQSRRASWKKGMWGQFGKMRGYGAGGGNRREGMRPGSCGWWLRGRSQEGERQVPSAYTLE